MDGYLMHIGVPRKSGRYPWGSGIRPFQSLEKSRLSRGHSSTGGKPVFVKKSRLQGMSDEELSRVVNRLNLENNYYNALKQNRLNKSRMARVKKKVGENLEKVIDSSIQEFSKSFFKSLGSSMGAGPNQRVSPRKEPKTSNSNRRVDGENKKEPSESRKDPDDNKKERD